MGEQFESFYSNIFSVNPFRITTKQKESVNHELSVWVFPISFYDNRTSGCLVVPPRQSQLISQIKDSDLLPIFNTTSKGLLTPTGAIVHMSPKVMAHWEITGDYITERAADEPAHSFLCPQK